MSVSIDKSTILKLATEASGSFIAGHAPTLTHAIQDSIGSTDYNNEQLQRIAQATNQAAWAKLSTVKDPSTVVFDLASAEAIASQRDTSGGSMHSRDDDDPGFAEKTAAAQPTLRKPKAKKLDTLKDVDRITKRRWYQRNKPFKGPSVKTGADFRYELPALSLGMQANHLAQARDRVADQKTGTEISFRSKLASLQFEADQLFLTGTDRDVILGIIKQSASIPDVGEGISQWVNDHGVWPTAEQTEEVDAQLDKLAAGGASFVTVYEPVDPGHMPPPAVGDVNPNHPLVKLSQDLNQLYAESAMLISTLADLTTRAREARVTAIRGE